MGLHRKHAKDNVLHIELHFKDPALWRAVFCEFFGTFIMLFVGISNIIASESNNRIDNLVTPGWTFAAIIFTLIHIIGPTSHCHMNPAVTISLMAAKRCGLIKGCLYMVVQILGSVLGCALVYGCAPDEWVETHHLGMNKLNPNLNHAQGLVYEVVGTCVLVLLVLVISDPDPKKDFEGFPALSAAMAVLACVFFMGPYTGCSLNPARSFGPAMIMLDFDDFHWIYWVGPIGGGLLAVLIYKLALVQGLHKFDDPTDEEKVNSIHPMTATKKENEARSEKL